MPFDMTPLTLISAHPWREAFFTSYSLSLCFFESVVLDALTRGGSQRIVIAADVAGVGAALGEWGARSVGKTYRVEPVAVHGGIFHPKVTVLLGDECHLLVGSGNLTFSGWGGNLEIVEHLHPSFAPEAFADAADMFEGFASAPRMAHGLQEDFIRIADRLRAASALAGGTGAFRLLHGSERSISDDIAALAADLGGARRLAVVSPYFDGGTALDALCASLGLAEASIHVHPAGAAMARPGIDWPRSMKRHARAVTVDAIAEDSRPLHGKLFEVSCRSGRLLVSGSANATFAALGPRRNVEAVVARIQRGRRDGWALTKARVPAPMENAEDSEDEDAFPHVLRATLSGQRLAGQVMAKQVRGQADVFLVEASGQALVGTAAIDGDGHFRMEAGALGRAAWRSDRLVVAAVDATGDRAEGFVVSSDYLEIAHRIGPVADRFLALLAGTETPSDVAAIMAWFCEHPVRLTARVPAAAGQATETAVPGAPGLVALSDILAAPGTPTETPSAAGTEGPGWSSFMDHVLAAFRQAEGPAAPDGDDAGATGGYRNDKDDGDDEDDAGDDEIGGAHDELADRASPRAFAAFESLLDALLPADSTCRRPLVALDLARYLCERLAPSAARATAWLRRILAATSQGDVPEERRADVAAAIVALCAAEQGPSASRAARQRLMRLGISISDGPPAPPERDAGFARALGPIDTPALWEQAKAVRTVDEQRSAYLAALASGTPSDGYPDLPGLVGEWQTLEEAILRPSKGSRILVLKRGLEACPKHYRALPAAELSGLRQHGFGIARNCCGRILVRECEPT